MKHENILNVSNGEHFMVYFTDTVFLSSVFARVAGWKSSASCSSVTILPFFASLCANLAVSAQKLENYEMFNGYKMRR